MQATPETVVPGTPEEADLIALVMRRNDVSQADIVRESGLDSAYVSRVCSGEYPITIRFARALYRLTNDWALHQFIFGSIEDEHEAVKRLKAALIADVAAGMRAAHDPSPANLDALAYTQKQVDLLIPRVGNLRDGNSKKMRTARQRKRLPEEGVVA